MELLKNPNFDFFSKTKYFVTVSLALIALGVFFMLKPGGIHYGVEFSGGTQLVVKFQNAPSVDKIRDAVEKDSPGASIQTYDDPTRNSVLIRLAETADAGANDGEIAHTADRVLKTIGTSYAENPIVESSTEIVGPIVGAELRQKAVQLTIWGLLFQLIYIAIRFRGAIWGAAATVAVLHDVLVTIAFLALFKFEFTLNVIAALLTLVGYSVNDTIVIFDRARENLKQKRKDPLQKILNDSLNQTLTRTLISNGTTFLSVLGLYLFGGEVLRSFGFTMVIGILIGTYSTIYIASPIIIWWEAFSKKRAGAGTGSAKAAL